MLKFLSRFVLMCGKLVFLDHAISGNIFFAIAFNIVFHFHVTSAMTIKQISTPLVVFFITDIPDLTSAVLVFGIGRRHETYVLISKQTGIVQLSSGFDSCLLTATSFHLAARGVLILVSILSHLR